MAGYNWAVDADVFSDQSVVYYKSEKRSRWSFISAVLTVLTHPPVKIVKLSMTEVNTSHGCLFCLQVKLES